MTPYERMTDMDKYIAERYVFDADRQELLEGMKMPFAIYQFINKRVVTLVLSDGFMEMFGYTDRDQAYYDMDNDMYKATHHDDVSRIANEAVRFATEGGKYEVIYRTRIKNGNDYKIIHSMGQHVYTDTGARLAHVWYTDEGTYIEGSHPDVNKLNSAMSDALHQESIMNASYYEALTGLPRMTYFFELVEAQKEERERLGNRAVMLFFDMNGMKYYNSVNGFTEGDKLLQSFARLLIETFSTENCCHMGGDHFAVYTTTDDGLETGLHRLLENTRQLNDGNSLPVRVGIYQYALEPVSVSTAIDRAKYACDELRDSYSSLFNYFKLEMRDNAYLRQYVVSNIDRAIEKKWIQVYYQPIVRAINGKTCEEEALARWIDPVKGFLSPAHFVPYLESAGLLYKLDLCVLDNILEKINHLKELGYPVVPHSINLSRTDFDGCDIVEEIRRRVDEAGIRRELINVEITESVIGRDFEYMKEQIARFRALGFNVWMDDFGSGYSSLDVLQEIPFDLIKFDLSFMQRLDKGLNGKIILTELMKMATSLGVDTVCEGVETKEQVTFLREIGCAKLQGFYFSKPMPLEGLLDLIENSSDPFYENPNETDYYESIGRVNLYDLAFVGNNDDKLHQNIFNTIPMCVLEINEGNVYFIRTNETYRTFMLQHFGLDLSNPDALHLAEPYGAGSGFMKMVRSCCKTDNSAFFDEELPGGDIVHSFARKISVNPTTGTIAVTIAILSVSKADHGATYEGIARALAADYHNLFYVDLNTERFIEYRLSPDSVELALERHGTDFFENSRLMAEELIYKEDRELFLKRFTKEKIVKALEEDGAFSLTYRMIVADEPKYTSMKITRMPDGKHIIIGVNVVDYQMRQKQLEEDLKKERDTMLRVMALSDGYLSLFTIDPETCSYTEYSTSDEFSKLETTKDGDNFFVQAAIDSEKVFHPDDVEGFRKSFTKENVMGAIKENGRFSIHYRLMIDGNPKPVTLVVAPFADNESIKWVAGVRTWKKRRLE